MWFVVGLGNPGERYAGTRHNAGFDVVDQLAARWGIAVCKPQLGALVGNGRVASEPAVLVKPQSYMNRSGLPTRSVLAWFKGTVDDLIVVHDDLDLPYGTVKVKKGGGHGGHNGLRDLHAHLGGGDYHRVRFGIGKPTDGRDTASMVLGRFTDDERADLPGLVERAADAVESLVTHGLTATMNTFNQRKAPRAHTSAPSDAPTSTTSNTPSRAPSESLETT